MDDYNPYYDNTFENNNQGFRQQNSFSRPFQINARNVLSKENDRQGFSRQILNQIEGKESVKKTEREARWEYERNIQNQPVVFLQQSTLQQSSQPQSFLPNTQLKSVQEANTLQGGIFAGVFVQRDLQFGKKQKIQQTYADEIQLQIEEKRRKKELEAKRNYDEDIRYEEQVKRDMEDLNRKYLEEEEKKQQEVKSIQVSHEQNKALQSKRKKNQSGFKEAKEALNDYSQILQKNNVNEQTGQNLSHQNILPFLQESLDDQRDVIILDQTNQYQQPKEFVQQSVRFVQQSRDYGQLDNQMKQYEEVMYFNRVKKKEQEEEIQQVRFEFDQQVKILNDEIGRLRAQEQISNENKQQAFFDLANLHDHLKRQEITEQQKLSQAQKHIQQKQNTQSSQIFQQNQIIQQRQKQIHQNNNKLNNQRKEEINLDGGEQIFVPFNSGSRLMGIPSFLENKLEGKFNSFNK